MARYVVLAPVVIPAQLGLFGYPPQTLKKGDVIEASAAQIAAWGVSARAVGTATMHDQLGEAAGVSNSSA